MATVQPLVLTSGGAIEEFKSGTDTLTLAFTDLSDNAFDDERSRVIERCTDDTFTIVQSVPTGQTWTINSSWTQSASGTATATFKIDGVALGGTANSVSSTEQEQTHSTSNIANAGAKIEVTISSNSNCKQALCGVEFTREAA